MNIHQDVMIRRYVLACLVGIIARKLVDVATVSIFLEFYIMNIILLEKKKTGMSMHQLVSDVYIAFAIKDKL